MEIIIPILFIAFYIFTVTLVIRSHSNNSEDSFDAFGKKEKEMASLILAFLKLKKYDDIKSVEILNEIFDKYSIKMFVKIQKKYFNHIISKYSKKKISFDKSCAYLSKKPAKYRLFVLYNLLDISAYDQVYSIEEEEFINNIRKKLRIHIQTFSAIKTAYTKKGMQEERKIIEEQNRKKLAESFLPYNAYKVLGISPTITKAQLKKTYRKLAKKYHPDKYHGQSEEVIDKAEDKFQEITQAYEIIKKHKQF